MSLERFGVFMQSIVRSANGVSYPRRKTVSNLGTKRISGLLDGYLRGILYALVPRLIRTLCFSDALPKRRLNATSWMNGLRGLSALVVFNLHYSYAFSYTVVVGYGFSENDRWIWQLPPMQLLYDGTASVIIFFTVAGYVCSYKALLHMTNKDYNALAKDLPASVFRRFLRLYLPPICSLFLISTLAFVGAYNPTRAYFKDEKTRKTFFPGPMGEHHAKQYPTFREHYGEWWWEVSKMCNIWWENNMDPPLDVHLWTILYEFRASMHLFIALVGLVRCSPRSRIFWLAVLAWVEMYQWRHFEAGTFLTGAIIAQIDVLEAKRRQKSRQQVISSERKGGSIGAAQKASDILKRVRSTGRLMGYCIAIYLLCFPARGVHHPSPGYTWLLRFFPQSYGKGLGHKFPKQLGTAIFTYLVTTIPAEQRSRSLWHRLFTCEIATYLGSIMFGLYIVHGMILHLFGLVIPWYIWGMIGKDTVLKYSFGLVVGWAISLVACLWAGDVWTREVEGRCTKITKWLEKKCFEDGT